MKLLGAGLVMRTAQVSVRDHGLSHIASPALVRRTWELRFAAYLDIGSGFGQAGHRRLAVALSIRVGRSGAKS